MVPVLSIVFMCLTMLFAIVLPVSMFIFLKEKYKTSVWAFFSGCLGFLVFALILEQIMHTIVLTSPLGITIQGNIWLYGIYGGLAAGLFEETARFLVMKFLLKKKWDNPYNAFMYGAGHGGFEAFIVLGFGMINNLLYSVMNNLGQLNVLLDPLPEASKQVLLDGVEQLKATSPWLFLAGDWERITAVLLHLSLSLLVWVAVVKRKVWLYPVAIALHALVDAVTVILNSYGIGIPLMEGILMCVTIIVFVMSLTIWKKECLSEENVLPEKEGE